MKRLFAWYKRRRGREGCGYPYCGRLMIERGAPGNHPLCMQPWGHEGACDPSPFARLHVVPAQEVTESLARRLHQVEAERDRQRDGAAYLEDCIERQEGRADTAEAELSIAREALEDALEGLKDMIVYVPEQFQEKWDHPAYVERAENQWLHGRLSPVSQERHHESFIMIGRKGVECSSLLKQR